MMKPTILLVDDNPDMLQALVGILELEDMPTITAENGQAAIALIRKNAPDLIILDMQLAGLMSGFDVLRTIREDPALASIPVVLHTGEEYASSLPEAEAADLVLQKPVDPDHLIESLRSLLGS